MENVNQNNLDSEELQEEIKKRKIREKEQREELEKYIKEIQAVPDLTVEEEISLLKQIIAQGEEAQVLKAFHNFKKVNDLLFGLKENGDSKPAERLFQAYRKLVIVILENPMKTQEDIVLKKIYIDEGLMTTLSAVELAEDSIRYAIRDLALREKKSSEINSGEEKKKIELQGFKIMDIPERIYEKVDEEAVELFHDYLKVCIYNDLHGFTIMRKRHLGLYI